MGKGVAASLLTALALLGGGFVAETNIGTANAAKAFLLTDTSSGEMSIGEEGKDTLYFEDFMAVNDGVAQLKRGIGRAASKYAVTFKMVKNFTCAEPKSPGCEVELQADHDPHKLWDKSAYKVPMDGIYLVGFHAVSDQTLYAGQTSQSHIDVYARCKKEDGSEYTKTRSEWTEIGTGTKLNSSPVTFNQGIHCLKGQFIELWVISTLTMSGKVLLKAGEYGTGYIYLSDGREDPQLPK